jgi:hypothetical protein
MLKIYILGFLVIELKFRILKKKVPKFCIEFKHNNGQHKIMLDYFYFHFSVLF